MGEQIALEGPEAKEGQLLRPGEYLEEKLQVQCNTCKAPLHHGWVYQNQVLECLRCFSRYRVAVRGVHGYMTRIYGYEYVWR